MSTGAVIAIVVVIVVVIAVVALVALEMRRRKLRRQFGPEYDRLVTELGSRRKAEAELSARQRRVAKLDIRPLTREETARYLGEWNAIQERFVDTPGQSVERAAALVTAVLKLRGYPADDQDEAMDALSVEHGPTLSRYREARLTSERARTGSATTDDLRNAMLQYRALFEELAARQPRAGAVEDSAVETGRSDAQTGRSDLETDRAARHADSVVSPAGRPADEAGATAPDSAGPGDDVSPQRSTRG
jgi:hypothetical protein